MSRCKLLTYWFIMETSVGFFRDHCNFGSNAYSSFLCWMVLFSPCLSWECHFLATLLCTRSELAKTETCMKFGTWRLSSSHCSLEIVVANCSDSHRGIGRFQLVLSQLYFESSSSSWLLILMTNSNSSIVVSFLYGYPEKQELPIDFSIRYLFKGLFQ